MPVRDTPWPAGTPCWVEVAVPDVIAATAFYGAVLGWSFVDTGEASGQYLAQVDGRAVAGIGPAAEGGGPSSWTVYLATDDADATAELITEHGGALRSGPARSQLIQREDFQPVARPPSSGEFANAPSSTGPSSWSAAQRHRMSACSPTSSDTWTAAVEHIARRPSAPARSKYCSMAR